MTTRSEKIKQTVISKYGSYEAYLEHRYGNPKAKADQKRAAILGGKNSGNRPFSDPEKAREAGSIGGKAKRSDEKDADL